jgi:penicillin-binding protein 1A
MPPSLPDSSPPPRCRWLKIFVILVFIGILMAVAAAGTLFIVYGGIASRYDLAKLGEMKQRSVVLDCKGREIGRLHGENRVVVPLSKVSPNFLHALLAREDARFYQHDGVDYIGVFRAIMRDFRDKKAVQGASTITMQLARNSYDDLNNKSLNRKLTEVMLARRIEGAKTKDQILELYVNRIFFGSGIYGIERASKAYFGKSADRLTLGEGAMLAGIIRGPNRFSPFRNWKEAVEERNTVLDRMVVKNFLSQSQADAAKHEEMAVAAQPINRTQESYMLEAVRHDLDLVLDEQDIEDGGLTIHTTLDRDLQLAAEQSLEKRLHAVEQLKGFNHATKAQFDAQWDGVTQPPQTPYLQGAVLLLDNSTGGVLAVVGGRDFAQSRFDRALMGGRQIGSSIKPLIYAAAFSKGLLPGTWIEDAPIRPGELTDYNGNWSPENSDGKFLGMVASAVGLIHSRNAMTVRVGNFAGMETVLSVLRDAGINPPQTLTPQIYIGNVGATLKTLTSAMSVFPNNGIRRRPFLIKSIVDGNNEEIYSTPVLENDVLHPAVAEITDRLLQLVMKDGTAAAARSEYGFKAKAGGKTGTTNDYHDAWFTGYTDSLTCGVWVGFDQPQPIVSGGYGAKLALPVWVDVMNTALQMGYKPAAPKAEPVMVKASLCHESGQLATSGCPNAYQDDLPPEMVPQSYCTLHAGGMVQGPRRGEDKPGFFGRIFNWFR